MDKVRIGVIGTGGMGQGHCNRIANIEDAELTAICDIDANTCQTVSEKHGVPGFTNHKELIESGLVDAVVIATPHYFHPPIGIDAFEAGLHVLTEKPIGVTVGAAEPMVAKAKESGKVFAIMFQTRVSGVYLAAKKLIEDGTIGDIYRACMISPDFRTQRYYDSGGWRATWSGEGGGVIINQAPHALDFFSSLVGLPSRVQAALKTRKHNIEVEDFAHCLMEFPNGAMGYLIISTDEYPGSNRIEISGDRAKMIIEGGNIKLYQLKTPLKEYSDTTDAVWGHPGHDVEEVPISDAKPDHGRVMQNFVWAILGKEELFFDGSVGLTELELGNAMHLSAHRNKPVDLPLDRQELEDLFEELRQKSKPKENVREKRETDPQHVKK